VILEAVDIVTELGLKRDNVHWICAMSFTRERERNKLAVVWCCSG
jgi:hypothetical protein